jgi:hypothetical protein
MPCAGSVCCESYVQGSREEGWANEAERGNVVQGWVKECQPPEDIVSDDRSHVPIGMGFYDEDW